MNKELSELAILRLETELLNAIENRDALVCVGDWNMVNMWDSIIDEIVDEVKSLGII
jgi:hypothetical protein